MGESVVTRIPMDAELSNMHGMVRRAQDDTDVVLLFG